MNNVYILDCTLRDGGYCNQWNFEYSNIKKIISCLIESNVEIVECGFLTDSINYERDKSKFTDLSQLEDIIPENRENKLFVLMVNYGDYDLNSLPVYDGKTIDGIRIAFHKNDVVGAIEDCKIIKNKGYKVFVQPMVSLSYYDEDFLKLIKKVNDFEPYAFYIVDSFGMMKSKDLTRLFYMIEHNLNEKVLIGFHSHNNMQLAYSNAQTLVSLRTNRNLIIDCSIYGMGRGAGNLNTELFIDFLNDNYCKRYKLKPILTIIDDVLNMFYQRKYWGYSLPNYISASYNAHPNYAIYLDAKRTLTVEDMDNIFQLMSDERKVEFDKEYIEELYIKYMERDSINCTNLAQLKERIKGRDILIIAPGKSSYDEKNKIVSFIENKEVITISINFDYPIFKTDYIFLSNLRRYRELDPENRKRCIVTSNISSMDVYVQIKYKDLINKYEAVEDNAGMMLVKFLILYEARKIYIAGLDGYSADITNNFGDDRMNFYTEKTNLEAMNIGMNLALKEFSNDIQIEFLTAQKKVRI